MGGKTNKTDLICCSVITNPNFDNGATKNLLLKLK